MRNRSRDAKRSDVVLFATSDCDHAASVTKPVATSYVLTISKQNSRIKDEQKNYYPRCPKNRKKNLSPHAELFLEMKVTIQRN